MSAVIFSAIFLAGCKHRATRLASSFSVADPSVSQQLISGFYAVETGFRWAGPTFTVALPPPPSSPGPQHAAKLTLSLYFPDSEIDLLGPVTITATGTEYQFGRATYNKAGPYDFEVELPPAAFSCTNVVPVTYSLDKYMNPANGDVRELAVVVNRISLRK